MIVSRSALKDVDLFFAEDEVHAFTTVESVVSKTAEQSRVRWVGNGSFASIVTEDDVVTVAAVHEIGIRAAVNLIQVPSPKISSSPGPPWMVSFPGPTRDDVIATTTIDRVVTAQPADNVVAGSTVQGGIVVRSAGDITRGKDVQRDPIAGRAGS